MDRVRVAGVHRATRPESVNQKEKPPAGSLDWVPAGGSFAFFDSSLLRSSHISSLRCCHFSSMRRASHPSQSLLHCRLVSASLTSAQLQPCRLDSFLHCLSVSPRLASHPFSSDLHCRLVSALFLSRRFCSFHRCRRVSARLISSLSASAPLVSFRARRAAQLLDPTPPHLLFSYSRQLDGVSFF